MAEAPKGQSCENCRYYRDHFDHYDSAEHDEEYDGFCRRLPPISGEPDGDTNFPSLNEDCWCGEWAPANPETVSEGATTLARLVLLGDRTAAYALIDRLQEERT